MPTYLIWSGVTFNCASEFHQRHFWRHGAGARGLPSVPHHVVVAVLDEITTVDELDLHARISVCVGETEIDFNGSLRRAAVEAGKGHLGCGLGKGWQTEERAAAAPRANNPQNSSHGFLTPGRSQVTEPANAALLGWGGQCTWQANILFIARTRRCPDICRAPPGWRGPPDS